MVEGCEGHLFVKLVFQPRQPAGVSTVLGNKRETHDGEVVGSAGLGESLRTNILERILLLTVNPFLLPLLHDYKILPPTKNNLLKLFSSLSKSLSQIYTRLFLSARMSVWQS